MSSYEKYMKLAKELDLCAEALEAEGDMKSAALVDEACNDLIKHAEATKNRPAPAPKGPEPRNASGRTRPNKPVRRTPTPKNASRRRTARKVYTASQLKTMKEAHSEMYDIARELFRDKDFVTAKSVLKLAEELEEEMQFVDDVDPVVTDDPDTSDQVCLDEELAEELSEALGLQGFDEYSPEETPPEALASARSKRIAAARRARLLRARKEAEARRASASARKPVSKPDAGTSEQAALRRARARRLARLRG